jgi:hypothetical protein
VAASVALAHVPNGNGHRPALARAPDIAPWPWTAPPDENGRLARAERVWRARREALERELADSARALAAAREDARAARAEARAVRAARAADASTLAILTAQLEAERIAHAVARATAARLAAARAQKPRRPDIQRRAQALVPAAAGPAADPGRLLADLDAAAAALRRSAPAEAAPPEAAPMAAAPPEHRAAPAEAERRLRRALVAFARHDPLMAGRLLISLLPAQGVVLEQPVSYDLTVRGLGTFAVSVTNGRADVRRVPQPRRRAQAAFHLRVDAPALAELLAGERARIGRFRGAARANRRRRAAELAPLASAGISLADAVRAGARLDPELVYAALPFAVEPEWTRGHSFTVAQEVGGRSWFITARDGARLAVSEHPPAERPDATVTLTHGAFTALLCDEPPEERPTVRGDRAAVAALKDWTDRARGVR